LDKEISNESESELGPLKYLAETTGYPMNQVVNWFLLLIIFVFDPLAIALVVASNMAFSQIRKPEESQVETDLDYINDKSIKEDIFDQEYLNDLEDYIKVMGEEPVDSSTYPKTLFDIPTHDPQTGELNPHYEELTSVIDEKRMDIIGQNGNDGLHYDKEDKSMITTTDDLTEKEVIELSREIAKKETIEEPNPIEPTKKDLEKLSKVLNIKYDDETGDVERLTDTTQTLIVKTTKDNNLNEGTTLKYRGR